MCQRLYAEFVNKYNAFMERRKYLSFSTVNLLCMYYTQNPQHNTANNKTQNNKLASQSRESRNEEVLWTARLFLHKNSLEAHPWWQVFLLWLPIQLCLPPFIHSTNIYCTNLGSQWCESNREKLSLHEAHGLAAGDGGRRKSRY